MASISVNLNDSSTRALLEYLGLLEVASRDHGVLTRDEVREAGVSWESLTILAAQDPPPKMDGLSQPERERALSKAWCAGGSSRDQTCELSEGEAIKALRVIDRHSFQIPSLFANDTCPDPIDKTVIVQNLLGSNSASHSLFGEVSTGRCSYEDRFARSTMGVYYNGSQVPEGLDQVGKSVLQIFAHQGGKNLSGSAVVTSDDGELMTARHVLFNESGYLREGLFLRVEGRQPIAIRPEHLRDVDVEHDMVRFRIPEAAGLSPIRLAEELPPVGEQAWFVGFPPVFQGIKASPQRTFSTGQIVEVDASSGRVKSDARIVPGFSGGAILVFDRKANEYRLLAINSFITKKGLINIALQKTNESYGYLASTRMYARKD